MMRLLFALGMILVTAAAGVGGGVGAVWAMKQSRGAECGWDVICRLAETMEIGGTTGPSANSCLGGPEISVLARFAHVLYAPDPSEQLEARMVEAMVKDGQCPALSTLVTTACRVLNGGDSNSSEACSVIAGP